MKQFIRVGRSRCAERGVRVHVLLRHRLRYGHARTMRIVVDIRLSGLSIQTFQISIFKGVLAVKTYYQFFYTSVSAYQLG